MILVINNDNMAYITGRFIGKTKLTDLSPKKTVEGFIGGLISTIILSFFVSKQIYLILFKNYYIKINNLADRVNNQVFPLLRLPNNRT